MRLFDFAPSTERNRAGSIAAEISATDDSYAIDGHAIRSNTTKIISETDIKTRHKTLGIKRGNTHASPSTLIRMF